MKNILVPTDFSKHSENAIEFAIEIAKKSSAEITLLHTYHIPVMDINVPASMLEEMYEEERQNAETELLKLCKYVSQHTSSDGKNIKSNYVAELDLPISEIQKLTLEKEIDLIVMGTEGVHHFPFSLNSTTIGVIDKVTCPILVVKEKTKLNNFHKICFALEDIKNDIFTLRQVIPLAKLFKSKVSLFHVNNYPLNMEELASNEVEKDDDKILLDALKEALNYSNITFEIVYSEDTLQGIIKIINEQTDLLTLVKQERKWLDSLFHKSVTKWGIEKTDLPLLIVHK